MPRPPLCPSPPNLILPRRLPPARRINSSIIQWPPRVEQRPSRAHHIASHQRHAGANVPRPRKRMNGARRPMRTHQHSRQRSGSPGFRRGGVRKKNARFDIPPERSLQNIDQLISESINDDEIRELKKEKLLLRNRQAAFSIRAMAKRSVPKSWRRRSSTPSATMCSRTRPRSCRYSSTTSRWKGGAYALERPIVATGRDAHLGKKAV